MDKLAENEAFVKRSERDLIKAVAHDIAKQVAHHIEIMYPKAVAGESSTFLLSVKGCVTNEIMAAIESNIPAENRIAFNDKFRRHIKAQYKKIRGRAGTAEGK